MIDAGNADVALARAPPKEDSGDLYGFAGDRVIAVGSSPRLRVTIELVPRGGFCDSADEVVREHPRRPGGQPVGLDRPALEAALAQQLKRFLKSLTAHQSRE